MHGQEGGAFGWVLSFYIIPYLVHKWVMPRLRQFAFLTSRLQFVKFPTSRILPLHGPVTDPRSNGAIGIAHGQCEGVKGSPFFCAVEPVESRMPVGRRSACPCDGLIRELLLPLIMTFSQGLYRVGSPHDIACGPRGHI